MFGELFTIYAAASDRTVSPALPAARRPMRPMRRVVVAQPGHGDGEAILVGAPRRSRRRIAGGNRRGVAPRRISPASPSIASTPRSLAAARSRLSRLPDHAQPAGARRLGARARTAPRSATRSSSARPRRSAPTTRIRGRGLPRSARSTRSRSPYRPSAMPSVAGMAARHSSERRGYWAASRSGHRCRRSPPPAAWRTAAPPVRQRADFSELSAGRPRPCRRQPGFASAASTISAFPTCRCNLVVEPGRRTPRPSIDLRHSRQTGDGEAEALAANTGPPRSTPSRPPAPRRCGPGRHPSGRSRRARRDAAPSRSRRGRVDRAASDRGGAGASMRADQRRHAGHLRRTGRARAPRRGWAWRGGLAPAPADRPSVRPACSPRASSRYWRSSGPVAPMSRSTWSPAGGAARGR